MKTHPTLAAVCCNHTGCPSLLSYERAAHAAFTAKSRLPRGWRSVRHGLRADGSVGLMLFCPAHNKRPSSRRKAIQTTLEYAR